MRLNYGATVPWVHRLDDGAINAIAGPERLVLRTSAELYGEDLKTVGEFVVEAGQSIPFVLSYGASFQDLPPAIDCFDALAHTVAFWREWSDPCPNVGPWTEAVRRSLITLKALTYAPTGGIVAAATTSLPERIGGVRNWDYRYCWLRDATFTLLAFMNLGYYEEARAWRDWLVRAVAGSPSQVQIMYGVGGERWLPELIVGIWEVRGGQQHFVHSKVMAWVAFDRAANKLATQAFNESGLRWREIADEIHAEVCEHGFDRDLHSFVQAYGSKRLDASLLLLPVVGFLPPEDPRIRGTLRAIEDRLLVDGEFVLRYETEHTGDGLPAGEGAFLACSFWLVDNYVLQDRYAEARKLFTRLLARCNDVGLLAEEFDPLSGRMLGNFPQAYSHVGLINCAISLSRQKGPADKARRSARVAHPRAGAPEQSSLDAPLRERFPAKPE
jgi:GH15 family glucan-1,4-alpha-glucosidase